MKHSADLDGYLTHKRWKRTLKRRRSLRSKVEHLAHQRETFGKRFGTTSKLIDAIATLWRRDVTVRENRLRLHIPESFSIIASPIPSLQTVGSFARAIRQGGLKNVSFDHRALREFDVAAEALLDLVADEVRIELRNSKRKLRFSGLHPKAAHAKRFIRGFGIVKHLEIADELLGPEEAEAIRTFHRRRKHYSAPARPEEADFKTRAITKFVDHVNGCLDDHGKQLTPESIQELGGYVGEVLSNAEEHSGLADWTIVGYLDNSLEEPICAIAIFNFGRTIAETLRSLDPTSYTAKQISPYIEMHRRKGFFLGPVWREEDLLSLVALQGHVSSKNTSDMDTRGQGTVDLIEFFQAVHEECNRKNAAAEMAILSGSTHIYFDGSYRMSGDNAGRKRIAFNATNDLYEKPDPKFVKSLGHVHFPGTIISIRFPLSAEAVEANTGEAID